MQFAIISDIHANLEALTVVLKDISDRRINRVYCLGDLVSYGPNPKEVIKLIQKLNVTEIVTGNHDDAVANPGKSISEFTELAARAVEWSRQELIPHWYEQDYRHFLLTFKETALIDTKQIPLVTLPETPTAEFSCLLVHASPYDHLYEYIQSTETATRVFIYFDEPICFNGHTHIPGSYVKSESKDTTLHHTVEFIPQLDVPVPLYEPGKRKIINVGSVGQSRDGNPQTCYLTVDLARNVYQHHRLDYDFTKTMNKIYKIEKLDKRLAVRLSVGR